MTRSALPRATRHSLRLARAALFLALTPSLQPANAYTVGITAGTRALFLQVGAGTMTGANFRDGGVPARNATVNEATVSAPAIGLGSGTALPMTTNSTVANSPVDGYAGFCTPATNGQVYVGGFYRVPGTAGAAASLSVTAPPNLVNGNGDTLPFGTIAWTSGGTGDATPTIPSGSFSSTGASSNLLSVTRNTWFESCLAFRYRNTQLVPGGNYTGRAVYTLTAP